MRTLLIAVTICAMLAAPASIDDGHRRLKGMIAEHWWLPEKHEKALPNHQQALVGFLCETVVVNVDVPDEHLKERIKPKIEREVWKTIDGLRIRFDEERDKAERSAIVEKYGLSDYAMLHLYRTGYIFVDATVLKTELADGTHIGYAFCLNVLVKRFVYCYPGNFVVATVYERGSISVTSIDLLESRIMDALKFHLLRFASDYMKANRSLPLRTWSN